MLEREKVVLDETVSFLQSEKIFLEKEKEGMAQQINELQQIYIEEKRLQVKPGTPSPFLGQ